jgi:hypothetical protein
LEARFVPGLITACDVLFFLFGGIGNVPTKKKKVTTVTDGMPKKHLYIYQL